MRFNPRVLAGGRDEEFLEWDRQQGFQSTRPRGRTRRKAPVLSCRLEVSIHASSREDATKLCPNLAVFIRFNPRVLAGGRDFHVWNNILVILVSIHASSREDATCKALLFRQETSFNPRVLAGGRDDEQIVKKRVKMFQSTRPRGRTRPGTITATILLSGFNPRVLAGGRDYFAVCKFHDNGFQSTRPRGRTRLIHLHQKRICRVSIHASSREDATTLTVNEAWKLLFQSTRPRGRTRHAKISLFFIPKCFNPRVLAGGRDCGIPDNQSATGVSIHASSREDATLTFSVRRIAYLFQSTRPRGRTRRLMLRVPWNTILFQSTRPRGRTRPVRQKNRSPPALFQSTRPRGRTRRCFVGASRAD